MREKSQMRNQFGFNPMRANVGLAFALPTLRRKPKDGAPSVVEGSSAIVSVAEAVPEVDGSGDGEGDERGSE